MDGEGDTNPDGQNQSKTQCLFAHQTAVQLRPFQTHATEQLKHLVKLKQVSSLCFSVFL